MDAPAPGASGQYSRSDAASGPGRPLPFPVRALLIFLGLAGAAMLIVSEFQPLLQVQVGVDEPKVVKDEVIGHEQHAYGLVILGAFALAMAYGAAWRASRPAMVALGALGLIGLLIALALDLPDVGRTGLVGKLYENAAATPELGFYLETLGAVLLVLTSGLLLLLTGRHHPRGGTSEVEERREGEAHPGGEGKEEGLDRSGR